MNKKVSTLVAALMAAGALVLPEEIFAQIRYAGGLNYETVEGVSQDDLTSGNYYLVFKDGETNYVAMVNEGTPNTLIGSAFTGTKVSEKVKQIALASGTDTPSKWTIKDGNEGTIQIGFSKSYPAFDNSDSGDLELSIDIENSSESNATIKVTGSSKWLALSGSTFSVGNTNAGIPAKLVPVSALEDIKQNVATDITSSVKFDGTAYILMENGNVLSDVDSNGKATWVSNYISTDKTAKYYWIPVLVKTGESAATVQFKNAVTEKMLSDNAGNYITAPAVKSGDTYKFVDNEITLSAAINGITKVELGGIGTFGVSAEELNLANRGSFILHYEFDKDHVATDNAFAEKNMRAFEYGGKIYFATSWPTKYNDYKLFEITDPNDFKKFTFLVANPSDHYNLTGYQEFGESAKFDEIKGEYLSFKTGNELLKDLQSGRYAATNAQFIVNERVEVDGYTLKLSEINGLKSDKSALETAATDLTVILVDDQDGRIVTTAKDYTVEEGKVDDVATISNLRTVVAKDFLSTTKSTVFNIKFVSKVVNSARTDIDHETMSEYNKYLTVYGSEMLAHGSDFANLEAPENQWIVKGVAGNEFVFQNRENDAVTFSAELVSVEGKANVYELRSDDELDLYAYVNKTTKLYDRVDLASVSLGGMTVELTPVTPNAEAGYATTELDNAGLVRMMFSRINDSNVMASELFVTVKDDEETMGVDQDETKAAQFSVIKFDAASTSTTLSDSIYATNDYAILKEAGKNDWKTKLGGDSISTVAYAFKQLRADGETYYLTASSGTLKLVNEDDVTETPRFLVKIYKNGSYGLIPVSKGAYFRDVVNSDATVLSVTSSNTITTGSESVYYDYEDRVFNFNILKETPGTSFNHVPQHVTMESVNGGYVAMNPETKAGVVAPVSTLKADYTKEDLTFWLDTTDPEAVTPSFMISKAGNYMYNAIDSLNTYNEGTASEEIIAEFGLKVVDNTYARAIFQSADLTKVEDINNYKFQIVQSADNADEYVVKSLNGYRYLAAHNQELYLTDVAANALKLIVTPAEAPTSNEGVSATEVKVVAQDGSVVVKNAAGKNVVVSTILGQVVANEVLTSDNATINVPAGIVVVAVEGESFKVNVK